MTIQSEGPAPPRSWAAAGAAGVAPVPAIPGSGDAPPERRQLIDLMLPDGSREPGALVTPLSSLAGSGR